MAVTPGHPDDHAALGAAGPGRGAWSRWLWFGGNTAVSVVLACVVIVLLNWLVWFGYARVGESVKPWVRYDWTATRAHSLSEQTRRVLDGASPGTELVGLFTVNDAQREAVADLLQVYASSGASMRVERIDPQRDAAARAALYERLSGRFADGLRGVREAVVSGRVSLEALKAGVDEEVAELGRLADAVAVMSAEELGPGVDAVLVSENLRVSQGVLARAVGSLGQVAGVLDSVMNEPLVPWEAARNDLITVLRRARGEVVLPVARAFREQARRRGVPAGVQNGLLLSADRLEALEQPTEATLLSLEQSASVGAYERMAAALRGKEALVIVGTGGVRIIAMDELFGRSAVAAGDADATARAASAYRFLGEDRVTGALVSVGLSEPVRVVFVVTGERPAYGQGGVCNAAAERLQSAGFELAQWQVLDAQGQSVTPPPHGLPGQRTVWVVLPIDTAQTGATSAQTAVADALHNALRTNDGVLLSLGFQRDADFSASNALIEFARALDIDPQMGRVALRPGVDVRGAASAQTVMNTQEWHTHSALGLAMVGRNVIWGMPSPMHLDTDETSNTQALASVGGPDVWVERDPMLGAGLRAATPDAQERAEAAEGVTVAALHDAQGAGRVMVVSDGLWLRDEVLASMQAVGNAELLVNSVYWLSRLDSAVGGTARSEALGLIGPMTDAQRQGWQLLLLAGLPTASALTGLCVWAWRRRG